MNAPKTSRQKLGRWGESAAAEYLLARGYSILGQNIRTPYGELDLVASHSQVLIFVEVKTRSSSAYGFPETAVTAAKQAHIVAAAQHYLQAHPEWAGDWRVDVIAIRRRRGQPVEIVHFENAVNA